MIFTDSHCHISSDEFDIDRKDVVIRAKENNVGYILNVCDDISKTDALISFCKDYKNIYTTVGVHPEIADKYENLNVENFLSYISSPYVVGIGECGLDYHYNADIKEQQLKILDIQIKTAQVSGLPLIIHNRESDEDMIDILGNAFKKQNFKGELHCFSSSEKLADFALSIGFYISASGIITFKNSDPLREIFKKVPNNKLLIETDSPFLAPTPYRGKRNEPAYVVNTAKVLAELKNMDIEKMAEITTDNFLCLFDKVKS